MVGIYVDEKLMYNFYEEFIEACCECEYFLLVCYLVDCYCECISVVCSQEHVMLGCTLELPNNSKIQTMAFVNISCPVVFIIGAA